MRFLFFVACLSLLYYIRPSGSELSNLCRLKLQFFWLRLAHRILNVGDICFFSHSFCGYIPRSWRWMIQLLLFWSWNPWPLGVGWNPDSRPNSQTFGCLGAFLFFLVHRFIIPFSSWWVPSLGCQTCPRFGTSGPVGLSKSGIPIFAGRIPLREIPRFGREITGRCGSVAKSWGLPPLGCACSGSGGLLAFAEFGSEKRQWKRLLL